MSISLPALAIAPQQQPDVLGQVAKIQQLRNLQQQQVGQLEIQQRQQALKDQAAMTKAYSSWDPNSGFDALAHSVLQNGGTANAAMAVQQHGLEARQKAAEI